MKKHCPYCNAEIPAEASFCPHCAKSLTERTETPMPKHIPIKTLRAAGLCLSVVLVLAAVFFSLRPKTYDGMGEVIYTDEDGSYQLLINTDKNAYRSMPEIHQYVDVEEEYRFPSWLYINHKDTGVNAGGIFMKKVESAEVHIDQPEDSPYPVKCKTPVPHSSNPDAALWTPIDYTYESPEETQIIWTIKMKNGDTIRLRSDLSLTRIQSYHYDAESLDLSDSAALQASIDSLVETTNDFDRVTIHLPAITYTEPLILHGRTFDLKGSEENGQRTTFTAGIQVRQLNRDLRISYFTDIDFVGDGSGIGVSAAGRIWTQHCSFSNWKTALLGHGRTVNTTDCTFTNNETGFHYNSTSLHSSATHYTGNTFTNNKTAVLLENVPSDATMNFKDCVFTGNETDINNMCDQPIDITMAVFQ